MVARLKAGSPRCGSGKIGIENCEDLEEAVLMLKKLGAEATDYVEVVLILEKWRLFSAFHQFQQR
jgi:hypothetical protein